MDLSDLRVLKDHKVFRDYLVLKARTEQLDHKVQQESMESPVLLEQQELLVQPVQ
jgi:hypothetical protein